MTYENEGSLASNIFNVSTESFGTKALEIFNFQRQYNSVYQQYCNSINFQTESLKSLASLPFLPISFFKTHEVVAFNGYPEKIFTSSGTTGMITSRHIIKEISLYEQSFTRCFRQFYGEPDQYAFLCLLPSYLEREDSSLVYMAEQLIKLSAKEDSGFFLQAQGRLTEILQRRERDGKKTILLGVTYALLDFALQMHMPLKHTIVMETGGMKGRRQELTRSEVHEQLKNAFEVEVIHSEYGMTELLSPAYAKSNGIFVSPPWMKVFVRSEDDPFDTREEGTGLLCIIDLANVYSCSFIETADMGRVYPGGHFEVLGRMDNSDIRGCSLLAI